MVRYNKLVNFVKKMGQVISSAVLKLSLYGFATVFALASVLGAPDSLKLSLREQGVYEVTVDRVLDAAGQTQQAEAATLPLDDPEVRQAAKTAFPPDTLEGWAGQFIDGLYDWLEGSTARPEFQIDMTNQRRAFAQIVADIVIKRVDGLRACSRQESLQLGRQNVDLSKLECRPPVDLNDEKQRLIAEIENNQDFLGDAVINSADLAPGGQPDLFEDSPLPGIFQWANRAPIVAAAAIILSIIGLLWLSGDKRRGIKQVGVVFLGSGFFLLLSTLLFVYVFNRANRSGGPLGQLPGMEVGGLQASLTEVIKSLFNTFNTKIIFVAILYLLIGAVLLLTLRLKHPARSQRSRPSPSV